MAVVTKAMGAFLVLMLVLLPYYRTDPSNAPRMDALRDQIEKSSAGVRDLLDSRLADPGEALERLKALLAELENARAALAEMRARLDQASAMLDRLQSEKQDGLRRLRQALAAVGELDRQLAALQAAAERLRSSNEQLARENAELQNRLAHSTTADVEALDTRIRQLTQQVGEMAQERDSYAQHLAAAMLERQAIEDRVASLIKRLEQLQASNSLLGQELASLKTRQISSAVIKVDLLGCGPDSPADAPLSVEPVLMPAGDITKAVQLLRWSEPTNPMLEVINGPIQRYSGFLPGYARFDSATYVVGFDEMVGGVDLYFRHAGTAEDYQKRLKSVSTILERAVRTLPNVDAQRATLARLTTACAIAVHVIGPTIMKAFPMLPIALFLPVSHAGRITINSKGEIAADVEVSKENVLVARALEQLCAAIPDECDLARRLNARNQPASP